MPKDNINYIQLSETSVGNERRREILEMPVEKGTLMPKTVEYRDIDDAFKDWSDSLRIVSDDGVVFPTMKLYSNQRFSEYSQSWKYTDDNNNLLLNFKTVTRENNPSYGKINSGLWNIPGERFYLLKRMEVLDKNGTESYLNLRMRQPMAADLIYKLSLFTNKYDKLNEFNTMINKAFQSRQCYLAPNGYYMPMKLDSISDESEYSIDDRQFYSQTYNISLLGYVITKDDMLISESPKKIGMKFLSFIRSAKKADIQVDEDVCKDEDDTKYTLFTITFPKCSKNVEFVMDEDVRIDFYEYYNMSPIITLLVNDVEQDIDSKPIIREGDNVSITIRPRSVKMDAELKFYATNPFEK